MAQYLCPGCSRILNDSNIKYSFMYKGDMCGFCQTKIDKVANLYNPIFFAPKLSFKSSSSGSGLRLQAAPPLSIFGNPPTTLAKNHFMISDTDTEWNSHADHVRLAYNRLDGANDDIKAVLVPFPSPPPGGLLDMEAKGHFAAVEQQMVASALSSHTVTEMTGEAAAALAILYESKFAGFTMKKGYKNGGAGVDQLWCLENISGENKWLVVEAKGPNASFSHPPTATHNVQIQFSDDWVIDRLARHSSGQNALANLDITLKEFNIKASTGLGFDTKKYYGVNSRNSGNKSELYKIAIQAKWCTDWSLDWIYLDYQQIY